MIPNRLEILDTRVAFKEARGEAEFRKCYPLLRMLVEEEAPDAAAELSESLSYEGFQSAARTGFQLFYAVLDEDLVLGTVGLRPFCDPLCVSKGYEINDFIVAKEWRGTPLARKLFAFAEAFARSEGGRWIRGMVSLEKPRVKKWYERQGYTVPCYELYKDLD